MTGPQKRYHLFIDINHCSSDLLNKSNQISDFIQQLAHLSEMQILFGPKIVEGSPTNPGFTGLAVIDYSHIAVHTFPPSGALFIDLFSCKPFPVTQILSYIKEILTLDDSQITVQTINLDAGDTQSLS
jgi:S-adenosylmethionine decarboxylase